MRHRVLVTRLLPASPLLRLEEACDVDLNREDRPLSPQELASRIGGKNGLLCLLTDTIGEAVMDAAGKDLKVISNYAVGYNNVDVAAASARGIPVTNTPEVLDDATADLTWALILDTVRRTTEGDRVVRRGAFPGWSPLFMLGGEVTGAILGLFGFGRIGQAVAARARGFRMRVLYHQRHRVKAEVEAELGVEYRGFEELLTESDILSIHAPLNDGTRHRFALAEFSRMKRTACLVNTSRGPIVKEADLAEALKKGLIAGAGVDVYESEPQVDPGLLKAERAVLVPHLGSATLATRTKMADIAVDNLLAVLRGERPSACVNPEVL